MVTVSSGFYRLMFILSYISTTLAVQVHPVARTISSPATCINGYSWMNDGQGDSPCLTVAYVEAACVGNNYDQPVLKAGYSYSLPNSTTANPCYCSWSSYNLMMACTLCQGISTTVSEWPAWASGCSTNSTWTQDYYPSGYELAGNASIPYWAITDPTTWTTQTFNIQQANATYNSNTSYITPGVSSSSSSSGSSPSSSGSSSSSNSTDVGAIVGGTVGGAAALLFFAVVSYLLYRRRVYKKGVDASAINQQGSAFMPLSGMTHNRIPSDTSNFGPSMSSPAELYGQSISPSQQYGTVYSPQPQTVYPSLQGSFSPPPRTDVSVYTTHTSNGQRSDVIPMV
ncbi:hypothetical protein DEU56DRAFT_784315 [Suillus clintonianus]|uniref:uncharacterized protein n=1 Tax=Suillus clintonianus TaxID=1904413 RepID=UPI001B878F44|nr:uncharacterized protein DEU56DRAFT_784315 [Suillus clintonianus]KAG2147504.1 hypothetical protein DEU56DRAFT_784315 [Suillus clintonianus]